MNKLLKEILRSPKPLRSSDSTVPADRWTLWADSLARRYDRAAGRSRSTLTYQRISRWLYVNFRHSLNVNWWAGAPFNSSVARVAVGALGSLLLAGPRRQEAFETSGRGRGPLQFLITRGSVSQIPQWQPPDGGSNGSVMADARKPVLTLPRLRHLEDEKISFGSDLGSVVAERTRHILPRLINDRQRIEMAMQRGAIKHKQPGTSSIIEDRGDPSSWQTDGANPGTFGSSPAVPIPGPDIERLTEQVVRRIDQRIVAHRERMGQAF